MPQRTQTCLQRRWATSTCRGIGRLLFHYASEPWIGESLALKAALIQVTKEWEVLTGSGTPCPIVLDLGDVTKTSDMDAEQKADKTLYLACQCLIGCGEQGWVPVERFEEAMENSREVRAYVEKVEEGPDMNHWPFDEEEYYKY